MRCRPGPIQQLATVTKERGRVAGLEQELAKERARLDAEGLKEWRAKVKDLETPPVAHFLPYVAACEKRAG